jgi:hypothetical protein
VIDSIEQEKVRQERLQSSRAEAVATKSWGFAIMTWTITLFLIVLAIFLIPAIKAWERSSRSSADKVPGLVDRANALIEHATVDLDAIALNVNQGLIDLNGTTTTIKAQTIPEINLGLASLRSEIAALRMATEAVTDAVHTQSSEAAALQSDLRTKTLPALNDSIRHTDDSVNTVLVPRIATSVESLAALMGKYGLTADEATAVLKQFKEKSGLSQDEVNALIADPRWSQMMDEALATFKSVAKTSKTVASYSKISIIVSLFSRVASSLIPGLLQ